jgi:hypothetical protein
VYEGKGQCNDGGGKYERAYLGLRDDLFFVRVCVSTVDDADDIRLCALHQSDRSPEHTLSATACIAAFRVSMRRRQMINAGDGDNDVLGWIHVRRLTSTGERNL